MKQGTGTLSATTAVLTAVCRLNLVDSRFPLVSSSTCSRSHGDTQTWSQACWLLSAEKTYMIPCQPTQSYRNQTTAQISHRKSTQSRPPIHVRIYDVIIWVQDGNCKKMARENFIIGAFYNITKNQDNPIKTVGRDSFLSPKTPKNTTVYSLNAFNRWDNLVRVARKLNAVQNWSQSHHFYRQRSTGRRRRGT